MSSRKWRDLLIVTFLALFFVSKSLFFIWLIVGAVIIFHPGSEKCRSKVANKSYRKDARDFGVNIPNTDDVHYLLEQVYDRYRQAKLIHPQLVGQYDEIIEELWGGLKMESSEAGWVMLLRKVLSEWPVSKQNVHANLQKKLRRVQEMSSQWQEARDEAYGEA